MKTRTSKEIRQMWLDFFESKKHEIVKSKSLIPVNDPSILWINSGVATLKEYFSGRKLPNNPRITNSQKSIRTNDIENVGLTARHQTFFEMLGNFSIGDYFKEKALKMALELLTRVYEFDLDKIYITYYEDDQETYNLWISLGIKKDHLIKGNREMNFWDLGMGPCGPDTEIFFDRGEKYDPENIGLKLLKEDLENDRYIEIWNIVFSQFNNDGEDNYEELSQKNIDTGAGLERIVSILQDVPTNFDTDLFLPIIRKIEKMSDKEYITENYFIKNKEQTVINKFFKIIADHIRAVSVAIQDGAKPSNTQRGYIIRRLIRRAYRSGIQLGIKEETFLYKLTPVVEFALDVYPLDHDKVQEVIKKEEKAFARTIKQGEEILKQELESTKKELDASVAFKLFETYGFPVELTQEIVEEKGIKLNLKKVAEFRKKHADASRGAIHKAMDKQIKIIQEITSEVSTFVGYDRLESDTEVVFQGEENGKHYILLNETPFYATKGGQQYDKGTLNGIEVLDVFNDKFENHWHVINSKLDEKVEARVNPLIRVNKERNHTGTHLLGESIAKVFNLGTATQLGSENDENRLRLDFPLDHKPTETELIKIEEYANKLIKSSFKREYHHMKYDDAISQGVLALEGEDYGEKELRVVIFGESKEFCGGTHALDTSILEKFKITKLSSKGSGVYRIEAITSNVTINKYELKLINKIKEEIHRIKIKIKQMGQDFKVNKDKDYKDHLFTLESIRKFAKDLTKKSKSLVDIDSFEVKSTVMDGMDVLFNIELQTPNSVKALAISLRDKNPEALVVIASRANGKTTIAIASSKYNAKEMFNEIAIDGKGGGNDNFAMGSASGIKGLDA
ncbi:MAG: alanine--tRNA ligase [Mycoplasmataceae bacterium]|nr:alanine--tRNA ligase [Mycoplasmataceae bacterium]